MQPTRFTITESFHTSEAPARREALQRIIDGYLYDRLQPQNKSARP